MKRDEVTNRLVSARSVASAPVIVLNGSKLAEAGQYLKSARLCLLTWVRENYVTAENVDTNTDIVRELLSWADHLENMRAQIDVKASILGK